MSSLATVVDSTLNAMADSYRALPPALCACDGRALRFALHSADGDCHRITAEDDGSIIVWNRPVW
ncbi:hypothetical protein DDP54_15645 (plasmid) [Cellulomonas sp. WB94]|nr:hypothetical protein DDP54_15645 [Cellulomonas sp. WB94]